MVEYDGDIVGYFSLVNDTIQPKKVDDDIVLKYRYTKLPAVKIARLATHKDYEGRGIGSAMMDCILLIVLEIVDNSGCRVITVDAKKEARGFYEKFAFKPVKSMGNALTIPMYLDIGTLITALRE